MLTLAPTIDDDCHGYSVLLMEPCLLLSPYWDAKEHLHTLLYSYFRMFKWWCVEGAESNFFYRLDCTMDMQMSRFEDFQLGLSEAAYEFYL